MRQVVLRAHHALCLQFFCGNGYSEEFVRNTYRILELLREDHEIVVADGADDLCGCCPLLENGICVNYENTSLLDRAVEGICGFSAGDRLTAGEFFGAAREKVILVGKQKEICGDCRWSRLCG